MSNHLTNEPTNGGSSHENEKFPEFVNPTLEKFKFLIDDQGWRGPFLFSAGRECTITFKGTDLEIKLAYEPLTLPWGYIKRTGKGTVALNEMLTRLGFHLDEHKYRAYDEARATLFALLGSPKEADQYAKTQIAVFHEAIAEYVRDISSFLRDHFSEFVSVS
jgi:hypothetical protein